MNHNINGNQNIVITDVNNSHITVNIDGQTQELRNDMAELKALMQQQNKKVQVGEKIFNIESIGTANFYETVNHHHHTTINTESKSSRYLRFFLLLFVPILAIGFSYFYYKNQQLKEPLSLTVFLQDKTPNPNIPFEGATVTFKYGDETKTETFAKEHTFRGIPPSFKTEGEKVSIHAEANGFFPLDTSFVITGNNITLLLRRNNDLGKAFGYVIDEENKAIEGATVSIQDISVTTDEAGRFTLLIPFEKQRAKQRIVATKSGYKKCYDRVTDIYPDEEIPIIFIK
ncbi:MAG: carboxypeptidase-like regulatory domain-containing protein [Bacteroidia bacterium]